uniref:HIT domain-containing protein n=1 Tax=Aegilops tauschii subsp. strangulata TaxID=200361 RepID=A0A453HPE0_AEGTS
AVLALGRLYCCCSLSSPPSPGLPNRPAAAASLLPASASDLPCSVFSSSSPLPPPRCPRGWKSRCGTSSGRIRLTRGRSSTPRPSPTPWSTSAPSSLVCPKREVKRFADLSSDETSDLWVTAKEVGAKLEQYHKASSITFAIQDGPQAGQTVAHVHIHVIPRKKGDFEKNDEIYDAIDVKEKEMKEKLDLDVERKDRSMEEMAHEATEYRALFS